MRVHHRWLILLAAGAASLVAGISCSAPPKGALMLAISTDMQTPKDIDVVSVYVTTDGIPKFDYLGGVQPDGTIALPATLAVVEPDNDGAQVRIRAVGFQGASARVLRDVITTVPHERTALLRLPLSFLDDGSGKGTIPANLLPIGPSAAPEGDTTFDPTSQVTPTTCDFDNKKQTSIEGLCASAKVDSSKLEAYDPGEVYGDGGLTALGAPARCFDVETCFRGAAPPANLDTRACAFPLPPGASASTLNLALVTPTTGACVTAGQCYVPIAGDPTEGWNVQAGMVKMPPGVCAKLGNGVTLAAASGACPAETTSDPVCEPTGADAGGVSPSDATAPDDGGVDATSPPPGDAGPHDAGSPLDATSLVCPGDLSTVPWLTATVASGSPPALTGGSVQDGLYLMTSVPAYIDGGSCGSDASLGAPGNSYRGMFAVVGGQGRLDIQDQFQGSGVQPDQCLTGPFLGSLFEGAGALTDSGPMTYPFPYGVSSDGTTIYVALGGSSGSCPASSDGSAGQGVSETDYAAFVLQGPGVAPDGGVSQEAGACGAPMGGGACNQVANIGPYVTTTCASGAPPAMTGGTVVDGTYARTSVTEYNDCPDSGAPPVPQAATVIVSGGPSVGCLQWAISGNGESTGVGPDGGTVYTITDGGFASLTMSAAVLGNQLVTTEVCPTTGTGNPVTFTATATTMTVLSGASSGMQQLEVYTKM
jgi:hypothetical protein